MALTDDDIAVAPHGPEYPTAPTQPSNGSQGFLAAARKRSVGNGTARLSTNTVTALPPITPGAQSAIMVLEAAPGGDKTKALGRFWMDGKWPDVVQGMPMYDGSVIEITGLDDLINTRMISTDGAQHKINVQYFSYL